MYHIAILTSVAVAAFVCYRTMKSLLRRRANKSIHRSLESNVRLDRLRHPPCPLPLVPENYVPQARYKRVGAIAPLAAIMLPVMIAIMAFVVDYSYMCLVKAEAQRCADAAALAGAGSIYVNHNKETTVFSMGDQQSYDAHDIARTFVELQTDCRPEGYTTEPNFGNVLGGDVVLGRIEDGELVPHDQPNAVRVTVVLRDTNANGSVSLFYPELSGRLETELTATAVIDYPTLLPFAIYKGKWDADRDNDKPTTKVFPGTWNGEGLPPGNFGALQIGTVGSAEVLMRQVDRGPTSADLSWHGNSISQGDVVGGKTGVNTTVDGVFNGNSSYDGIIGLPRYLALYSSVSGNGANSEFVIHSFVMVRVISSNLRTGNKYVTVEPIDSSTINNLRLVN